MTPRSVDAVDVKLRRCELSDVECLRQVARETYDDTFRSLNAAETMDAYLAQAFDPVRLAAELVNPGSEFWFLFVGGELAGYLKVNDAPAQTDLNDPDSLEVERIYVRRANKGRGLGRMLMEHAIDLARGRGRSLVWLGVWEKNLDAIAFYERMGFRETGRHAFRMGEELQCDLVMTLQLTGGPSPVAGGGEPSSPEGHGR